MQKQLAPNQLTLVHKALVIKSYAKLPTLAKAAKHVGISPNTVYNWKQNDEEFALALDKAHEEYRDYLREMIHKRATGIERPVIFKGELQYRRKMNGQLILDDNFEAIPLTTTEVSDRMLEKLAETELDEYKKKDDSQNIAIGINAQKDSEVKITFVDAPKDWEKVEWDKDTGQAIIEGKCEVVKDGTNDTA